MTGNLQHIYFAAHPHLYAIPLREAMRPPSLPVIHVIVQTLTLNSHILKETVCINYDKHYICCTLL